MWSKHKDPGRTQTNVVILPISPDTLRPRPGITQYHQVWVPFHSGIKRNTPCPASRPHSQASKSPSRPPALAFGPPLATSDLHPCASSDPAPSVSTFFITIARSSQVPLGSSSVSGRRSAPVNFQIPAPLFLFRYFWGLLLQSVRRMSVCPDTHVLLFHHIVP